MCVLKRFDASNCVYDKACNSNGTYIVHGCLSASGVYAFSIKCKFDEGFMSSDKVFFSSVFV